MFVWVMLFGKTLHYRQKTKEITHILIQQFVPECTADDKREFIQTFMQPEYLENALGK